MLYFSLKVKDKYEKKIQKIHPLRRNSKSDFIKIFLKYLLIQSKFFIHKFLNFWKVQFTHLLKLNLFFLFYQCATSSLSFQTF